MRRLLLLNWRDPWHPKAGGAELMTLRLLEPLVARGWEIEWFSAAYGDAPGSEKRQGIQFVRKGNQSTVHASAFARYRGDRSFDLVVDEINTIPFFSPLYANAPTVALMYQLAREIWFYEAPAWLAPLGFVSEPLYLQAYRNTPIVTISESSAMSMRRLGLSGPIHIVPIACDERALNVPSSKDEDRTILLMTRLAPSKRIEHSIRAAALMRKRGWAGTLAIAGSGESAYVARLRRYADRVAPGVVRFLGRVSDTERTELMQRAAVLWMTSRREGWGLVITEANRNGTPAVVYDVPGLRDAVEDGLNGFVVKPAPDALVEGTLRIFARLQSMSESALVSGKRYEWSVSAQVFESVIDSYAGRKPRLGIPGAQSRAEFSAQEERS